MQDIQTRDDAEIVAFHWNDVSNNIIENVNVWLNIYDRNLNLTLWNSMAEKISGYSREEVLCHMKIWTWLYPDEEYRNMIVTRAAGLLTGEESVEDWETEIRCKDGSLKTIAWSSRAIYDDRGAFQGAITFGYDMTDRKKAAASLKEAHDELSVLYHVASATAGPLELEVILDRALEQVLPAIKSAKGFIHLWDDENAELYLAAYSGVSEASISELTSLRPGEQIIGRVFELEAPVSLPNIVTELDDVPAHVPDRLFHAYLGVPMRTKGRTRGVFSVLRKADQEFTEDEVNLLTSIAGQIGVAVENARLYQQSHQLAVAEERRRLARNLHDVVTQSLYSLTLFAEAGQRALRNGDLEDTEAYLIDLGATAQNALREMRLLLHELRPLALESEGLVEAIQLRLDAVERRAGVKAIFTADAVDELPPAVEQELYHIIQEALNNTLRHGAASRVTVTIGQDEGSLQVKITDNGVGYDPAKIDAQGGMGLQNMAERVHNIGGNLTIASAPGEGVEVTVTLPVEPATQKDWKVKPHVRNDSSAYRR